MLSARTKRESLARRRRRRLVRLRKEKKVERKVFGSSSSSAAARRTTSVRVFVLLLALTSSAFSKAPCLRLGSPSVLAFGLAPSSSFSLSHTQLTSQRALQGLSSCSKAERRRRREIQCPERDSFFTQGLGLSSLIKNYKGRKKDEKRNVFL